MKRNKNNNNGKHIVNISKLIRSSYKYCFPHCSFCEKKKKKMLFNSVFVRVDVLYCFKEIWQVIPNTRCHI